MTPILMPLTGWIGYLSTAFGHHVVATLLHTLWQGALAAGALRLAYRHDRSDGPLLGIPRAINHRLVF